jgi:hypothetical protein
VGQEDLLRKIDRTLERNTDAFERNREAFERNLEASERNREAFERTMATLDRVNERLDRHEERDGEFRRFLDALTERHVGITQHLIESIDSGFAKLQGEIADQRAQIQANTEALLKVLDRLEPRQGS